MAQQIPAIEQTQFGGVVTSGHPLYRQPNTAARCNNLRVMPGNWIRLRSGRVQRSISFNAINRLHEVRLANGTGYVAHFWQVDLANGQSWWQQVLVNASGGYIGYIFEQLYTGSGGYTAGGFPAIANCRNRVMMSNGQGFRDSTSRPALTQTFGDGGIRYVGLDAFCPVSAPTVTAVDSGGGTSHITYKRDIYVGLYNSTTGHFGNGVFAGTVASSTPGTVTRQTTITVNSVTNLVRTSHSNTSITDGSGTQFMFSAEASELSYVFYATQDGGSVPYLLVDTSGVPVTTTASSKQLDLDSLVASSTQEMPRFNFPPRPMSAICYANGRVYGVPMPGGSGGDKTFAYPWADTDMAKVTWSAAADDSTGTDFLGIPEESWPLTNNKYTPNGQRPKHIAATADGTRVLVITQTGTFLLEETADGLHTWYTVSLTSGIWDARSFAVTPYGMVWFSQNKQIVMLPHGSMSLQVLSDGYAAILKSPGTKTPGAYVLDPPNLVDRYQLWLGDGTSVCHDFAVGNQAYTADNQNVTAAMTLLDLSLKPHHIMCIGGYAFTQEGQPDTASYVPVADETARGVMDGGHTWAEINGDYIGQWANFGDSRQRKEIADWVVSGDAARSAQLSDAPLKISWFGDLDNSEQPVPLKKLPQCDTDMAYQGKLSKSCKRWFKPRIQVQGHSTDAPNAPATTVPSYTDHASTGDLTPSVYGALWSSQLTVNPSGDR